MDEVQRIIEDGKNYLQNNDLDGFYKWIRETNENANEMVPLVSDYFLSKNANPLEYMTYVPTNFLSFEDSYTSFFVPGNIESIMPGAFKFTQLENITIEDGVELIDDSAFYSCKNLKKVVLSDTIWFIGEYAFAGCRSLTDINVPKNLKKVGAKAFDGCPPETYRKFEGFM